MVRMVRFYSKRRRNRPSKVGFQMETSRKINTMIPQKEIDSRSDTKDLNEIGIDNWHDIVKHTDKWCDIAVMAKTLKK